MDSRQSAAADCASVHARLMQAGEHRRDVTRRGRLRLRLLSGLLIAALIVGAAAHALWRRARKYMQEMVLTKKNSEVSNMVQMFKYPHYNAEFYSEPWENGAPGFATKGAAARDVRAMLELPRVVYPGQTTLIPTGFGLAIPPGKAIALLPRSGMGHKRGGVLGNLVGLIDEDYRDEVFVSFWNRSEPDADPIVIQPGERIAQALEIAVGRDEWAAADALPDTDRAGGFGSTGAR